ncbi:hypothetical protein PIB30_007852 [Stylosanthes scabra]|uniref:Transposase (Putative), gypsy type n=1 Tax=Stylosanthes scabra TaxID=79078 RepID=A0ABU6R5S1_9FABA|nr:hypothetical protein [Stylosanthes scabra]
MRKKRSCQDVRKPRPLSEAEAQLYGRLETAWPFDHVPFRVEQDGPHFLWGYQELFTRLGVTFPLSDFKRSVLTRCKVVVNQLHLNGWGFLRAFERVCLHFGFHPTARLFLYIYDILFPPSGKGYVSFRAHQGRRLLGSYEESIQEFKWHYFKMLAAPGKRVFWLDDEDSFLEVKMKQNRLDKLRAQLADTSKMGPRFILSVAIPVNIPAVVPSAAAGVSSSTDVAASPKVGLQGTLSSKLKNEKELATAQDPIVVLTAERDSALVYLPLKKELASCRLSLKKEQKRAEVADKDVSVLNTSLSEEQTALDAANASVEFWEAEWKKLGDETLDMSQETLEIVLDQVSHLSPRVDFFVITLDTRWDPKSRRIINRKEASKKDLEMMDDSPHADVVTQEQ